MIQDNPKIYIVGAGPGAPDLLTLRAARLIERADVVIFDYLLDEAALKPFAKSGSLWIDAGSLAPRQPGHADERQAAINAAMIRHARAGKLVVRLKGGDPMIFARSAEEMLALAEAGISFEFVPGVTAALAAAAAAGIPLTSRDAASSVLLATGHSAREKLGPPVDWAQLARAETLVLYMSVKQLEGNARRLIETGLAPETPAAVISRASMSEQRIISGTLENIATFAQNARIASPAIVIIGNVVKDHASHDNNSIENNSHKIL